MSLNNYFLHKLNEFLGLKLSERQSQIDFHPKNLFRVKVNKTTRNSRRMNEDIMSVTWPVRAERRTSNSINASNVTVEEVKPKSWNIPSFSNKSKKSKNFDLKHKRKLSAQNSVNNDVINFKRVLGFHITQNNNGLNIKTSDPFQKLSELNFKNSDLRLGSKGKLLKFFKVIPT